MRHRCLALVACVAAVGTIANASPHRHKKTKHRVKVALDDQSAEPVDAPEQLHLATTQPRDWSFALGPNVWASSVDAKVSLGSQNVSTGIDFFQMSQHARYGVPLLAEARYGRFSALVDFMYGVVDIDGSRDVGPLMVTAAGTASSLMVDGFAGFTLAGDHQSMFALEARGGIRYQRTAIDGELAVNGANVTSAVAVFAGTDALAGARAFVRPYHWLGFSGNFDFGMFGSSKNTWSAAVDANVRATSRLLVTVGWRTLEVDSSFVSLTMHGPRAALQLVF